jgi:hypothetical protein
MWKIGSLLASFTPTSANTAANLNKDNNDKINEDQDNKHDNTDDAINIRLMNDSKKQVLFKDFLSYYNENAAAIDNYNSSIINNNENEIDDKDNTTGDYSTVLAIFHKVPSPLETIDMSLLDKSPPPSSSSSSTNTAKIENNNRLSNSSISELDEVAMTTTLSSSLPEINTQIIPSLNNNHVNASELKKIAADVMVLYRDSQLVTLIQGIISHWNKFNNQIKLNSNINYNNLELKLFSLYITKIFHSLPTRLLIASTWRTYGNAYWNRYRNIEFCSLEETIYILLSNTL